MTGKVPTRPHPTVRAQRYGEETAATLARNAGNIGLAEYLEECMIKLAEHDMKERLLLAPETKMVRQNEARRIRGKEKQRAKDEQIRCVVR